jgi:hypothetical protein
LCDTVDRADLLPRGRFAALPGSSHRPLLITHSNIGRRKGLSPSHSTLHSMNLSDRLHHYSDYTHSNSQPVLVLVVLAASTGTSTSTSNSSMRSTSTSTYLCIYCTS